MATPQIPTTEVTTEAPPHLPPSYSDTFVTEFEANNAPEHDLIDLPTYTRRQAPPIRASPGRAPKEFKSELNRKGKSWAILAILADSLISKSIPTIVEGSDVTGSVKLILDSGEAIQAVTVSVKGQIIMGAGAGEQLTFLEIIKTLWSQSMGDPRSPSQGLNEIKYGEKLRGTFGWPFSISLPKEVVLAGGPKKDPQVYRLPQTFLERHARASVKYDVIVKFTRHKMRADDKIHLTFGYIPITKPAPPSPLRQLAYQENTPLWGPEADPRGWCALETVKVQGKVFNERTVHAKCTLSLATPLCYTRGSVIPCFMVIETDDLQALDLLSSPKAIVVRLRRRISHDADADNGVETFAWRNAIEHSQLASWWPSTEGASDVYDTKRQLSGELHLPVDMKPSTAIAHFKVEYSIVLFPFDAIAFEPADSEPLGMEVVEIVTSYASGPRPRSYTPPGYEAHHASVADGLHL